MMFIDRLKTGWDILKKLDPSLANHPGPFQPDSANPIPGWSSPAAQPTLRQLIAEIGVLPPYSIVVGGCDDQSHIFLDLKDPSPGSILITGDSGSGKTRLLQSILTSAIWLNAPRQVMATIIAADADLERGLGKAPNLYKSAAPGTPEAAGLLFELADLAEQRRTGQPSPTAVILAIDDLARFWNNLDEDAQAQFTWLVQNGPFLRVWPVATLTSDDVDKIGSELINAFGTRLIGSTESTQVASLVSGSLQARANHLIPGEQFGVMFGQDWVRFWVPALEEVTP